MWVVRGVDYSSEEFVLEFQVCKGEIRGPEDVLKYQKTSVESEKELKEAEGR